MSALCQIHRLPRLPERRTAGRLAQSEPVAAPACARQGAHSPDSHAEQPTRRPATRRHHPTEERNHDTMFTGIAAQNEIRAVLDQPLKA